MRIRTGHIDAMTGSKPFLRGKLPPSFFAEIPAKLAEAGHGEGAIAALLDLDAEMFAFHRRGAKGELVGKLIGEMGLTLELAEFTALTAISRITYGIGREVAEPATVGLLAEELGLDPSRASRLATSLIAAGWVRRAVAQDDGRKSVLEFTDKAVTMFARFRDLKWQKMIEIFAGWEAEDIEAFARLFARYGEDFVKVYSAGA